MVKKRKSPKKGNLCTFGKRNKTIVDKICKRNGKNSRDCKDARKKYC